MIDQTKAVVEREWKNHPPLKDKKVTISLMWGDIAQAYHVLHITNTTWYVPGMWLSKEIVGQLCDIPSFEVDMIADTLWENIAKFAGGIIKVPGITL